MNIDIESIDENFNFHEAYKRNYCTLINIAIIRKKLLYSFKVDMVEESIGYPNTVYYIVYCEWQNKNWFELKPAEETHDLYWSSPAAGSQWLQEHLSDFGLEKLSKEGAYQVAYTAK